MKRISIIFLFLLLIPSFGFNSIHSGDDHATSNDELKKNQPTKELMISTLTDLFTALEKEDYASAKEYLLFPENVPDEVLIPAMSKLIERKEISLEGIHILDTMGTFGKVVDLYGDSGQTKIEAQNLDPDSCYGLYIESSSVVVMAQWDEKSFKFFQVDNIGKLEQ
ncbi:hypothetical protein [Nonlabens xiamenensis]|uniref:hypothetical protein n=1 Tax=Nonlabens xiamenensis TaxID=2341043 RepID=UPI000F614593|nr:hypothetical protein [Nonlabens xiamenensis]